MKVDLATRLGWSLYEINRTDIVDLLRFVARLTRKKGPDRKAEARRVFADQTDWI